MSYLNPSRQRGRDVDCAVDEVYEEVVGEFDALEQHHVSGVVAFEVLFFGVDVVAQRHDCGRVLVLVVVKIGRELFNGFLEVVYGRNDVGAYFFNPVLGDVHAQKVKQVAEFFKLDERGVQMGHFKGIKRALFVEDAHAKVAEAVDGAVADPEVAEVVGTHGFEGVCCAFCLVLELEQDFSEGGIEFMFESFSELTQGHGCGRYLLDFHTEAFGGRDAFDFIAHVDRSPGLFVLQRLVLVRKNDRLGAGAVCFGSLSPDVGDGQSAQVDMGFFWDVEAFCCADEQGVPVLLHVDFVACRKPVLAHPVRGQRERERALAARALPDKLAFHIVNINNSENI